MNIYAIKRVFKNGKEAKHPLAYFKANNSDDAFEAFGYLGLWSNYSDTTAFSCNEVKDNISPNARIHSAEAIIEEYNRMEEEWNTCEA